MHDEAALAAVEARLAASRDPVAELFRTAQRLDLAGRATDAQQAYLDVLALDIAHAGALNNLGALLAAAGYQGAARLSWEQAVARCPDDPRAYVNLGNQLRQDGEPGARAYFEAALLRCPALPEAHQGMAHLLSEAGDETGAAWHRERGFAARALTTAPFRGAGVPVDVLQLVSCVGGNIPTRHLLSDRTFRVHTVFAEYADRVARLPPHAVVFNAIGDAELCQPALAAATVLLRGGTASVLNPPHAVAVTARANNAARLGRLPGVIVPRCALLPRATLAAADAAAALAQHGLGFPLLLRAPGFHTGRHFVKVQDASELPEQLAHLPGETLIAIEFLDTRSPDGCARKYRAMIVGGQILPLHLAISEQWKVHYYTSNMADRPEHRAEEAAFLQDMPGVLGPIAMDTLARIAETLALDYAGVDFAVASDGRLMLFEANATMVVAPPPDEPHWAYRQAATAEVLASVHAMILARRLASPVHAQRAADSASSPSMPSTTEVRATSLSIAPPVAP